MNIRVVFVVLCSILFCTSCSAISKEDKEWIIKKSLTDLVYVKGGTFMLGDVGYTDSLGVHQYFAHHSSALPVHQVTLDSYSIGKLEVTYKEFDLFCKATGRELVGDKYSRTKGPFIRPELTAVRLTWDQAMSYCEWLSKLTGLPFNLATNAQWEYAARNRGKAVGYATDNGLLERGRNLKSDYYVTFIHNPPPGSYPPNPLGLYDMSGSKPEWVRDGYVPYLKWNEENPLVDTEFHSITIRGFNWDVYNRGYRDRSCDGAGVCIRFVVNKKEAIDVKKVLKRLGITAPSEEEIAHFMPKTWVEKGKYPL
jgi:formylglycine-generating enzyme required for sulfatase activity